LSHVAGRGRLVGRAVGWIKTEASVWPRRCYFLRVLHGHAYNIGPPRSEREWSRGREVPTELQSGTAPGSVWPIGANDDPGIITGRDADEIRSDDTAIELRGTDCQRPVSTPTMVRAWLGTQAGDSALEFTGHAGRAREGAFGLTHERSMRGGRGCSRQSRLRLSKLHVRSVDAVRRYLLGALRCCMASIASGLSL
jgi:hypothetical protein